MNLVEAVNNLTEEQRKYILMKTNEDMKKVIDGVKQ